MVQTNVNSKVILTEKVRKSQEKKRLPKNPSTVVIFERKKENNPVNNVRIKTQVLVAPYFSKCVVHIIYYTQYYPNYQKTHTKIEIGWYRMVKLFLDSVTATKGVNPAQNNPYSLLTWNFIQSIGKNIGPNSYKSVLVQYVTLSTLATLLLAITMTTINSMRKNTGIFVKHGKNGKSDGKSDTKGTTSNKSNRHGNGKSHDIAIYQQIHTLEMVTIEARLVAVTKIVTHFTLMMLLTPKATKNKLHDVAMTNKLGKRPTPAPAVQTVPTHTWSSLSWSVAQLKGWGELVNAELQTQSQSRDIRPSGFPPGPPEPQVLDLDVGDLVGRVGDLEGEQVSDLEGDSDLGFPPPDPLPDPLPDPEGSWDLEGRHRTESGAQIARTESGAENLKKMKQTGKSPQITINYNSNNFTHYKLPQFNKSSRKTIKKIKANLSRVILAEYLTQESVFLLQNLREIAQVQVVSTIKVKERKDRPPKPAINTIPPYYYQIRFLGIRVAPGGTRQKDQKDD